MEGQIKVGDEVEVLIDDTWCAATVTHIPAHTAGLYVTTVQGELYYRGIHSVRRCEREQPTMPSSCGPILPEPAPTEGVKFDSGKPDWALAQWRTLDAYVRVLTFGARKYAPDNWRKVPNLRARYFAAAMRHVMAWWRGELLDPETGEPHLAHAICCLAFLCELQIEGGES